MKRRLYDTLLNLYVSFMRECGASSKSVMRALWKTFPTGSATWPLVGNSNMGALTTALKAICLDGILRLSGSGRLTDGSLCLLSNTELFGAKLLVFSNSMMKVLQSRLC